MNTWPRVIHRVRLESAPTGPKPEPAFLDDCRNPDGSYDGIKALAKLSGLSRAEVLWTWTRIRALKAQGVDMEQARLQIKDEARARPWER